MNFQKCIWAREEKESDSDRIKKSEERVRKYIE